MKIPGQTNLDQLEVLPAGLRAQFRSLWIDSVEECLAVMGAADSGLLTGALGAHGAAFEATRARACAFVAPARAETLLRARTGGALGCQIAPEVHGRFRAEGRLDGGRTARPVGFARPQLPQAVRLMADLPPVKNQGDRGTCVAFASVALREYLAGGPQKLSEQYLYWACKQLDGRDEAGTSIHTAMSALSNAGVCRAGTWPYNPVQDDRNESQHPPPAAALAEAPTFRMTDTRTVEPGLIEHYKQVLAGAGGAPGMPVAVGFLVFRSWYMSAEAHRTGKITLPLPGEMPLPGGHALCAVGYVDDDQVPGGGYLILRNSWGPAWAADNPEAAGHALMPYAYVEMCAVEAFTGPAAAQPLSLPPGEDDLAARGFTRALNQDTRDTAGRLLVAGTPVLCRPSAPEEIMEDTAANRSRFMALDCAWSHGTRQTVWFPPVAALSADRRKQFDAARALKLKFCAALNDNLLAAVRTPFPQVRMPAAYHLIPFGWEPRVKRVDCEADLTAPFLAAAKKHSGVREDLDWPDEWEEVAKGLNSVCVYSLNGFLARTNVVVAFVTRLQLQRGQEPTARPVDQEFLDLTQEVYREWLAEKKLAQPEFTFFTIGTAEPLPANISGLAAGRCWQAVSGPTPEGRWETRVPPPFSHRLAVRDFLERLKPETRQERIVRIKTCVEELFLEGGYVTIERVKRVAGYRRSLIREAFAELQNQSPESYRLWKTKDGQLAIRRAQKGEPIRLLTPDARRKWLRRHALQLSAAGLGTTVTAASLSARSWLVNDLHVATGMGIAAGLVIAYVGSCFQNAINRRADS